jgi:hypothetical protein
MDSSTTQKPVRHNMASQLGTRIVGVLFMIWLAIGAVAAGQRGYFGGTPQN